MDRRRHGDERNFGPIHPARRGLGSRLRCKPGAPRANQCVLTMGEGELRQLAFELLWRRAVQAFQLLGVVETQGKVHGRVSTQQWLTSGSKSSQGSKACDDEMGRANQRPARIGGCTDCEWMLGLITHFHRLNTRYGKAPGTKPRPGIMCPTTVLRSSP
jgi:hypothetical protein